MAKILVVYGTAYGHTARIADRIGEMLRVGGHSATVHCVDCLPSDLAVATFGGFVVASPVLFDRHLPAVRRFVRHHVARLNAAPSAFVSVCGAMGNPTAANQRAAAEYIEQFARRTGWHPQRSISFAGAMAFTRYGFILRRVMRRISAKNGGPTDTSRDYDCTDWADVDRFVGELAELFATAGADRAHAPLAISP